MFERNVITVGLLNIPGFSEYAMDFEYVLVPSMQGFII